MIQDGYKTITTEKYGKYKEMQELYFKGKLKNKEKIIFVKLQMKIMSDKK